MNSTEEGIKRFLEFYGEIGKETIQEFLGINRREFDDCYGDQWKESKKFRVQGAIH